MGMRPHVQRRYVSDLRFTSTVFDVEVYRLVVFPETEVNGEQNNVKAKNKVMIAL